MRKLLLFILLFLVWLMPGANAGPMCEGCSESASDDILLNLLKQEKDKGTIPLETYQTLKTKTGNELKDGFYGALKRTDEAGTVVNGWTSLIAKWDNLTIEEAKSLYTQLVKTEIQGSKVVKTQAEILLDIQQRGITNPYNFAFPIEDYNLSKDAIFVRVHNSWNPNRPWLISLEEFKTFTSQDDMIKKLALPITDDAGNVVKPAEISIVKLPAGTKVRKSVARPQDWPGQGHQSGGAVQFEIRENPAIPKSWFKPMGNLSDYLN